MVNLCALCATVKAGEMESMEASAGGHFEPQSWGGGACTNITNALVTCGRQFRAEVHCEISTRMLLSLVGDKVGVT